MTLGNPLSPEYLEVRLNLSNGADQTPELTAPTSAVGIDIAALKRQYGEPYYLSGKANLVGQLNESFWAGLHDARHIQLYDPDEGTFYRYDTVAGIYRDITEEQVKNEISNELLDWSRSGNPELEKKRSYAILTAILAQLKGIAEKRGAFQNKKTYVHLANTVIEFKNHQSEIIHFSPKLYSRNQSPINFVEGAKCDRFLNELMLPALSSDDFLIAQKYAGLCLLGRNIIQRFCIFDGPAGSGKSTLCKVIQKVVGLENATELRTKYLADRFEIFRYLKKTLLTSVDVPGGFMSEKGAHQIKGLVGGDYFDAERKGGNDNNRIKGEFPVLITSNCRLHVKLDGDQGAWKRRFLICRFNDVVPAIRIPDFDDVLIAEEGPGIINFMLEGLAQLLEDVAKTGDIDLPASQKARIDALLAESDQVKQFLAARVNTDPTGDLATEEIINAFAEYCSDMGWQPKPITTIERELPSLMLELFQTAKCGSIVRKGKTCKGYSCVTFKS